MPVEVNVGDVVVFNHPLINGAECEIGESSIVVSVSNGRFRGSIMVAVPNHESTAHRMECYESQEGCWVFRQSDFDEGRISVIGPSGTPRPHRRVQGRTNIKPLPLP